MREIKRLAKDQAQSLMQDYRLNTATHAHKHTHTHTLVHRPVHMCSARLSSATHHMQMPAFLQIQTRMPGQIYTAHILTLPVLDIGKVCHTHIR